MAQAYKFTDRKLQSLKPKDYRFEEFDSEVPGLGLRVTEKGTKTFFLLARFPGYKNPARRAVGIYSPHLDGCLASARRKAAEWKAKVATGIDPGLEEKASKRANLVAAKNSFEFVAEEFIKRAVSKNSRAKAEGSDIRQRLIKAWGSRPIASIKQYDVVAVIDEITGEGHNAQAHYTYSNIRRLFNWAVGRGIYGIEFSPCDRLSPKDLIGQRAIRERVLSDDEVRAFWLASGKLPYPFGPQLRMLALTIQRRNEVGEASWPEFDLDKKLWLIPAKRMKARAPHAVPLSLMAAAIVASLPKSKYPKGDFIFSTTFGEKPSLISSKIKTRLDELMLDELRATAKANGSDPKKVKLEPFVIHDLRRTGRTGLSTLAVPDIVRELVIAHTQKGLHKVYDQHKYLDEKRHALELWACKLRDIVEPPPSNITKLRAAG
jgi:integrase